MKTPEQIAEQAARDVLAAHDLKQEYVGENPLESLAWELGEGINYEKGLTELVKHAIEADRKQRDIYELIAEALDERADAMYHSDDERGGRARTAARSIRGEAGGWYDAVWDTHVGPMLDAMEEEYGR